ncbi:MAG: hypothetical protein A4E48_00265 [Methanosaeta sp. PtaU1.Bin060]|nr:MAG: hypothetical protein A4E48_00265 [Methanosaeta sp. PtaU1.Bin060]
MSLSKLLRDRLEVCRKTGYLYKASRLEAAPVHIEGGGLNGSGPKSGC